jgi:hypothetical protein
MALSDIDLSTQEIVSHIGLSMLLGGGIEVGARGLGSKLSKLRADRLEGIAAKKLMIDTPEGMASFASRLDDSLGSRVKDLPSIRKAFDKGGTKAALDTITEISSRNPIEKILTDVEPGLLNRMVAAISRPSSVAADAQSAKLLTLLTKEPRARQVLSEVGEVVAKESDNLVESISKFKMLRESGEKALLESAEAITPKVEKSLYDYGVVAESVGSKIPVDKKSAMEFIGSLTDMTAKDQTKNIHSYFKNAIKAQDAILEAATTPALKKQSKQILGDMLESYHKVVDAARVGSENMNLSSLWGKTFKGESPKTLLGNIVGGGFSGARVLGGGGFGIGSVLGNLPVVSYFSPAKRISTLQKWDSIKRVLSTRAAATQTAEGIAQANRSVSSKMASAALGLRSAMKPAPAAIKIMDSMWLKHKKSKTHEAKQESARIIKQRLMELSKEPNRISALIRENVSGLSDNPEVHKFLTFHATRAVNHLLSTFPQQISRGVVADSEDRADYHPHELREWTSRLRAIEFPDSLFEYIEKDMLPKEIVETIASVYPAKFQSQIISLMGIYTENMDKISYEKKVTMSKLTGSPMTQFMIPETIIQLQGIHAGQAMQDQQAQSQFGPRPKGTPRRGYNEKIPEQSQTGVAALERKSQSR